MKCKHRIALLLAVLLLCALPVTVYAHEVPDETRKGSITVDMKYDGQAVTGGTLKAYQVGRIQQENGNYRFVKTPAMADFSGNFDDISAPKLAEDIAAFVQEHQLELCAVSENRDGTAVFSNLELGLYLIVQTKSSDGYEPLKPFLVSVPMREDGHYVYQVNADGKFQLHQEPQPTTPTKPADPTLPDTGQLNWPIPVLVVLGLILFSLGWVLRFGKKKDGHEK